MARPCDHCGADPYFSREFPRVRDESMYWQTQAKRLAAQLSALKLDEEFAVFQDRTNVAWLQAKVVAQARELKRLNDSGNVNLIRADREPVPDVTVRSVTAVEVGAQQRDAL